MANESVRFMITIPKNMVQRAEDIKKSNFCGKPYAEMYRQLIKLGLEQLEINCKK